MVGRCWGDSGARVGEGGVGWGEGRARVGWGAEEHRHQRRVGWAGWLGVGATSHPPLAANSAGGTSLSSPRHWPRDGCRLGKSLRRGARSGGSSRKVVFPWSCAWSRWCASWRQRTTEPLLASQTSTADWFGEMAVSWSAGEGRARGGRCGVKTYRCGIRDRGKREQSLHAAAAGAPVCASSEARNRTRTALKRPTPIWSLGSARRSSQSRGASSPTSARERISARLPTNAARQ